MTPRIALAGMVSSTLVLVGCIYPADDNNQCVRPTDDKVWIDNGEHGPGYWCFDDGDGYPRIYPPVTTSPSYPTTGT